MKRAICVFALCLTLFATSNVYASTVKEDPSLTGSPVAAESALSTATLNDQMPVPVSTLLEIKDERHIMTKLFEIPAGETIDPSELKEQSFKLDGYSYSYFETEKEEIYNEEKREEKQEVKLSTDNNDAAAILEQLNPDMAFDKDGFIGKLLLDHAAIVTEVEGYVNKTYTINDSQTLMNLSSNDPVQVPKYMTNNGIELKLKTVDWRVNQSDAIDYNSIPTSYTAVAHYSGSYSKKIATGYVTTAYYTGEVIKRTLLKTEYTLTYLGEKLPEPTLAPTPTPEPTPIPTAVPTLEPIQQEHGKSASPLIWVMGFILLLLGLAGGAAAYLLLLPNTTIFIKEGEEDYKQIAKRNIRFENPVVDLTDLDVAGKEVAVYVKKRIAQKLFGRHIKTVVGDFSISCLVDKQNCDYWYVVEVPDNPETDFEEKPTETKKTDTKKTDSTDSITKTESKEEEPEAKS